MTVMAGCASTIGHICASSEGGPGSTTTVDGAQGTISPGAVPIGSITWAPSGTSACLSMPSV